MSQRPDHMPDPAKRWRPRWRAGPMCAFTFDAHTCRKRGAHYCLPRADQAVRFFEELLVHTKGRWSRSAFLLEPFQEWEIIRPLFGEVMWSADWGSYVRRYQVGGIVLGRKNGKSELGAGIVLKLLVGDDEEAAEVYGAAKDTKQARKVGDVVERMRQLSPLLADRLGFNKNERRVFDEVSGSYYEVIPADAKGELGHNPHGVVIDEVLSQPDGDLWAALRTAAGARHQPLFLLITTETNDPVSFGAEVIDELERIAEQPSRNPRWFAYVRKLPSDDAALERLRKQHKGRPDLPSSTDPWDSRNWAWPNPGLGAFLSAEQLHQEALEAANDPTKENPFRQYRLNQRVQQVSRYLPLSLWDECAQLVPDFGARALDGALAFGGLDLASTTDLAAWCLWLPELEPRPAMLWRFWTPEAQLPALDRMTGGLASTWVREGRLEVTEGDWIDYEVIHRAIVADHQRLRLVLTGYDPAQATATAQHLIGEGLELLSITQGYALSEPIKELLRMVKAKGFAHGGHPVARWCADAVEVRRDDQDRLKLVKPDRAKAAKRIDGIAAAVTALRAQQLLETRAEPRQGFAYVG